jgi:hypothetical protein
MDTNQKIEAARQEIIKDTNLRTSILLSLCESPIEQLFLINAYCYFLKGSYNFHNISLICEIAKTSFDSKTNLGQVLTPYHFVDDSGQPTQIKGFEITGGNFSYQFIPQFCIETQNSEIRIDIAVLYEYTFIYGVTKGKKIKKYFGIECDGYDFHSTKEQQTADNKRTRILTELGWTMLRYSGQEIYKMNGYKDFSKILMTLDKIIDNNLE